MPPSSFTKPHVSTGHSFETQHAKKHSHSRPHQWRGHSSTPHLGEDHVDDSVITRLRQKLDSASKEQLLKDLRRDLQPLNAIWSQRITETATLNQK
jgi:hypothetical protein